MTSESTTPAVIPPPARLNTLRKERDKLTRKIEEKRSKLEKLSIPLNEAKRLIATRVENHFLQMSSLEFDIKELFARVLREKKLGRAEKKAIKELQEVLLEVGITKDKDRESFEGDLFEKLRGEKGPEEDAAPEEEGPSRDIRKKYLKLASFCHPDKAATPEEARSLTAVMQDLNKAYAANDLASIVRIEKELGQGAQMYSSGLDECRELEREIEALSLQLEEVGAELKDLERSPAYRELVAFLKEEGDLHEYVLEVTAELAEGVKTLEQTKAHILKFLSGEISAAEFMQGPGGMEDEVEEELFEEFMHELFQEFNAAQKRSPRKKSGSKKAVVYRFAVQTEERFTIEVLSDQTLSDLEKVLLRAVKRRRADYMGTLYIGPGQVAVLGPGCFDPGDDDLELNEFVFKEKTPLIYEYESMNSDKMYKYELVFLGKCPPDPQKRYPLLEKGGSGRTVRAKKKS